MLHVGSVVVVPGLESAGSIAVVHGLSCFPANRIFPDQESKLSPVAAGGFFTTEPPGKPTIDTVFKDLGVLTRLIIFHTLICFAS